MAPEPHLDKIVLRLSQGVEGFHEPSAAYRQTMRQITVFIDLGQCILPLVLRPIIR